MLWKLARMVPARPEVRYEAVATSNPPIPGSLGCFSRRVHAHAKFVAGPGRGGSDTDTHCSPWSQHDNDRDGDGEVNEEEFLRIMKKTNLF